VSHAGRRIDFEANAGTTAEKVSSPPLRLVSEPRAAEEVPTNPDSARGH
jgi:hypothetical protein